MNLEKKIEKAKEFLRANGYYTENLWNINDVKNQFKCTDEAAQSILDESLSDDYIMSIINATISDNAKEKGFEEIVEE
jgi:hypothetical protein